MARSTSSARESLGSAASAAVNQAAALRDAAAKAALHAGGVASLAVVLLGAPALHHAGVRPVAGASQSASTTVVARAESGTARS